MRYLPSRVLPSLAFAAAVLSPAVASAQVCTFNLTGAQSASFQLGCTSTAPRSGSGYSEFDVVAGSAYGVDQPLDIEFSDPTTDSGIDLMISPYAFGQSLQLSGVQLFTGPTSSPTFTLGTFALTDRDNQAYTLSITAPGVPEPATWAMMLVGFAGIGWTVHRQKRAKRALAAA